MLREAAVDEEHYQEITAIGMRSAIIVPMTTRGRTLGALTWVNGRSGRRFDEQDVDLAHESPALRDGDRQRPPLPRPGLHRPHASAKPPAGRAA